MADFRKVLVALAVLVFVAGLANAQAPLTCSTTFVRPQLRAEGVTELVGDIVFTCPTGAIVQANLVNFTVFTDARITSRVASGTSGISEALLLVNDPGPGGATPVLAGPNGCTGTAPAACDKNVFQGTLSAPSVAAHSVTFLGVPVVPTGTNVKFRITNIRVNAQDYFGAAAAGAEVPVEARLSISPSEAFNFEPDAGVVGRIQKSMTFSVVDGEETATEERGFVFRQCLDIPEQEWTGYLQFSELFGTAFKKQVATVDPRDNTTAITQQEVPGLGYNSESGLLPTGLSNDDIGSVADTGTRLRATFNNIPEGLSVFVSNGNIAVGSGTATEGAALLTTGSQTAAFSPTGDAPDTPEEVTIEDGTGVAIWEVVNPVATAIEKYNFGVAFARADSDIPPTSGVLGLVTGNYAPTRPSNVTSTAWANARTSNIPRFVDPGTEFPLVFISVCRTNLLFPYVLGGVAGFDTGLAISNTSEDPWGTVPQHGPCTLSFFGVNAPATPFVTKSIGNATTDEEGRMWSTNAMSIAPSFAGYVIAQCDFQFGHGFAFVSDIGAHDVAMGYLALILPGDLETDNVPRTVDRPLLNSAEDLNN